MNTISQVAARLLPNGQLVIPGVPPDPVAICQILGSTEQAGVKKCFVWAELAGTDFTERVANEGPASDR